MNAWTNLRVVAALIGMLALIAIVLDVSSSQAPMWLARLDTFAGPVGLPMVLLAVYALGGLAEAWREAGAIRRARLRHTRTMGWGCFALGLMGTYLAVIGQGVTQTLDTAGVLKAMGSSLMGLGIFVFVMIASEFLAPGQDEGE